MYTQDSFPVCFLHSTNTHTHTHIQSHTETLHMAAGAYMHFHTPPRSVGGGKGINVSVFLHFSSCLSTQPPPQMNDTSDAKLEEKNSIHKHTIEPPVPCAATRQSDADVVFPLSFVKNKKLRCLAVAKIE